MAEQTSTSVTPWQDSEEEVHLSEYLSVVFRRRKAFLTAFLTIVIGVALYTFLISPTYEASTTLHVQSNRGSAGARSQDFLSVFGLSQDNPVETEIEILRSRTNIEKVVRQLHLNWKVAKKPKGMDFKILEFTSMAEDPRYNITLTGADTFKVEDMDGKPLGNGHNGILFRGPNMTLLLDGLTGSVGDHCRLKLALFNETVKRLRKQINASEVGQQSNIIQVTFNNTDPILARNVLNTLSNIYLERNLTLKTEEARKSVRFIHQQIGEVRKELDRAEQNLENYQRASGVVQLDTEAQNLLQRISDVEKSRSGMVLQKQQVDFAVSALEEAMKQNKLYAPSVLMDDPVVAGLAQNLANLEAQKRGLRVDFTADYPTVKAVQEQILSVERRLLATYKTAQQGLGLQIQNLKGELTRYEAKIRELPAAEQQLAKLSRLAKVNADIYTFLLQKQQEARIARASTISNVNVIDPAIVPDKPVKPKKALNLILGVLSGLFFGFVFAVFREHLDDTIKDADSVKRLLGWPTLAIIPFIGRNGLRRKKEKIGNDPSQEKERTLITHIDPKSVAAEAFRVLRTSLHFITGEKQRKVILITSSFPGEGKTTISANLAETLAQTDSRVLLVGCDLRRPTLHTIFDTPKTPGLTELLIGDAEIDDVIHVTGMFNLDFISAGTVPPNPAELIGGEQMRSLIQQLRERYDTIVLDAPPLLAVTDAALLTAFSDQVVIIIEAGGVTRKAAERGKEILESVHAPIIGFVFNDKTGKGAEYYGGHYEYYGGDYYDGKKKAGGVFRFFRKSR